MQHGFAAEFKELAPFLERHSRVTTEDSDAVTTVSTALKPGEVENRRVLVYRHREEPAGPDGAWISQVIYYAFVTADLDAETVNIQRQPKSGSEEPFWYVTVRLRDGAGPIRYTNVFETKGPDGQVDVTSSRSRVRMLAIGYFEEKEQAETAASLTREMIAGAHPAKSGAAAL